MLDIKDAREITVFDNEYMTMKYLLESGIVYHIIHKRCTGEVSRKNIALAYKITKEYGVKKWLTDDRKRVSHSPEISEWVDVFLEEHLVEAGWKYWAIVVPTDIDNAAGLLVPYKKLYDQGLRIAAFMETGRAFQWLNSWE